MPTPFTLPPLPYAYDALEPVLDAATLRLHHDLHHKGYVDGANAALAALSEARAGGDFKLVEHWGKKLAFHLAGHQLHSLFWQNLAAPGQGGAPSAELLSAIDAAFGSRSAMEAHFSAAARSVEGSGWAMLAWNVEHQALQVLGVENHQKVATWSTVPLLVCDVWEHAYYLKYQNRRADWVQAFWSVVNWKDVSARFAVARR